MTKAVSSVTSEAFAGVEAKGRLVATSIAEHGRAVEDASFPMTREGLGELSSWLRDRKVRKVALLQGKLTFPWQRQARWDGESGPIDLEYWLRLGGPDALEKIEEGAEWQPLLLALRDAEFDLFVIAPSQAGGLTSRQLATRLANGDFAELYPKSALERLIDGLSECRPEAVAEALDFFTLETRGHWHNRARAKIARRVKHCTLDEGQSRRFVEMIERRLIEGSFTEQFKDQLGLLLTLDPETAQRAAQSARQSSRPHVQKYGHWLAEHLALRPRTEV